MADRQSVLIVEDDDDLRRLFRTYLMLAGFEVYESADGYSALAILEQRAPTAIVLDLGLPAVSGYIVLQEIAAHMPTRNIPVIVVTAQDAAAQTDGVACLLRKPVTPERLVDTVRTCISAGARAQRL